MANIKTDYHMHTTYCDGTASAEEMIKSAIEKGLSEVGISGHSYTSIDESYCMSREDTEKYIKEINILKQKYAPQIKVFLGVEQDYFADIPSSNYDYAVGSVHYVYKDGEFLPVDESAEIFAENIEKYGGDVYSFIEDFYELESKIVEHTNCRIIGHFSLVTKFNEGNTFFTEDNPRYIAAYQKAVDKLVPYGVPFEINTGAITKGLRSEPYPSYDIIKYIASKGGKFIFSSDSHKTETICAMFDEFRAKLAELGVAEDSILESIR